MTQECESFAQHPFPTTSQMSQSFRFTQFTVLPIWFQCMGPVSSLEISNHITHMMHSVPFMWTSLQITTVSRFYMEVQWIEWCNYYYTFNRMVFCSVPIEFCVICLLYFFGLLAFFAIMWFVCGMCAIFLPLWCFFVSRKSVISSISSNKEIDILLMGTLANDTNNPNDNLSQINHPPTINKQSRTNILMATLNMKGRSHSNATTRNQISKWTDVHRLLRQKQVSVLCLQETHLNNQHISDINQLFNKRITLYVHLDKPWKPWHLRWSRIHHQQRMHTSGPIKGDRTNTRKGTPPIH